MRVPSGSSKMSARSKAQNSPSWLPTGVIFTVRAAASPPGAGSRVAQPATAITASMSKKRITSSSGFVRAGITSRRRAIEFIEHRGAMLLALHVDEIEHDDAAEVAQPQLPGHGLRRFQVRLEDRVVEIAATDIAAGVDIDRRHRLGLVDDEIAAR